MIFSLINCQNYNIMNCECVSDVFFFCVCISEVLSQPILEIVPNNNLIPVNRMKLICHVQYNAPAPAPPVHYYFYRDNERLGTATSENNDLVRRTPGQYSCRAKVPELGIARLSEPKSFGVKGT